MDALAARQNEENGRLTAKVDALELELAEERRQKTDALSRLQEVEAENGKLRERVAELERTVEQLKPAAKT